MQSRLVEAPPGTQVVGQSSTVRCFVCGVERRQLSRHVKAAHAMTRTNYLSRFPGALLDSPASRARSSTCRDKQRAAASRRWSSLEERKAQSERLKASAPWRGKKLSEAHKASISEGRKGQARPSYKQSRGSKAHSGDKALKGQRSGIPHRCSTAMEANLSRVLLKEGIPYEHAPRLVGATWAPVFRLTRPLSNLLPAGWVMPLGWRQRNGYLPAPSQARLQEFEQVTGEPVFVLCQNSVLWEAIVGIYANGIASWENPKRSLDLSGR